MQAAPPPPETPLAICFCADCLPVPYVLDSTRAACIDCLGSCWLTPATRAAIGPAGRAICIHCARKRAATAGEPVLVVLPPGAQLHEVVQVLRVHTPDSAAAAAAAKPNTATASGTDAANAANAERN